MDPPPPQKPETHFLGGMGGQKISKRLPPYSHNSHNHKSFSFFNFELKKPLWVPTPQSLARRSGISTSAVSQTQECTDWHATN